MKGIIHSATGEEWKMSGKSWKGLKCNKLRRPPLTSTFWPKNKDLRKPEALENIGDRERIRTAGLSLRRGETTLKHRKERHFGAALSFSSVLQQLVQPKNPSIIRHFWTLFYGFSSSEQMHFSSCLSLNNKHARFFRFLPRFSSRISAEFQPKAVSILLNNNFRLCVLFANYLPWHLTTY